MTAPSARCVLTVKVPAKIMLAGEYAVLRGGSALAATLNQHLTMKVSVYHHNHDDHGGNIELHSALWRDSQTVGRHNCSSQSDKEPLIDSACAALEHYPQWRARIDVDSGLDIRHGFGSSSALRLALASAALITNSPKLLNQVAASKILDTDLLLEAATRAYQQQRRQQGQASGYDILSQLHGGFVLYTPDSLKWPGALQKLTTTTLSATPSWLTIMVGGRGAPTTTTMAQSLHFFETMRLWPEFMQCSQQLLDSFIGNLTSPTALSLQMLIEQVRRQRQFLAQLAVVPQAVSTALQMLDGFDRDFSFKTTGAGGEDSLLLIGAPEHKQQAIATLATLGWHAVDAAFTNQGIAFYMEHLP